MCVGYILLFFCLIPCRRFSFGWLVFWLVALLTAAFCFSAASSASFCCYVGLFVAVFLVVVDGGGGDGWLVAWCFICGAGALLLLAPPGFLLRWWAIVTTYRRGSRRGGLGGVGDGSFSAVPGGFVALQKVEDGSHGAADVMLGLRGEFFLR